MKFSALVEPLMYRLKDSRSLWLQADVAVARGDHERARSIYRHLAGRTPVTAEEYLYSALSEYETNGSAGAIRTLESGLKQYPEAKDLLEHFQRISSELGDIDTGLGQHQESEALLPDAPVPAAEPPKDFLQAALSAWRAGNAAQATALVERCSDVTQLWQLGDLLLQNGCRAEAADLYRRLAARKPDSPEAFLFAALAEYRLSRPEAAVDVLERGMRRYPQAALFTSHYARISGELGRIDRVLETLAPAAGGVQQACEKLLRDAGDDWKLKGLLIEYCLAHGFAPVGDAALRALQDPAVPTEGLWQVSDVLLESRRTQAVESLYAVLLERTPQTAQDFLYAGLAASRLEQVDRAIGLLEAGLDRYPGNALLAQHHFRICSEDHQVERALTRAEPLPERWAAFCETRFAQGIVDPSVHVALIAYCNGHGLEALAAGELEKVRQNCRDIGTLWQYADALAVFELPEAIPDIYAALSQLPPQTSRECLQCALAAQRCKRPREALRMLESALERYPDSIELTGSYVNVAFEVNEGEQAMARLAVRFGSAARACEVLFDTEKEDWQLHGVLIAYALEHGLASLADRRLQALRQEATPPVGMWRAADQLQYRKHSEEADALYRVLVGRTPREQDDYFYAALAAYRLRDTRGAIGLLEAGLAQYPDDEALREQHLRICCEAGEAERALAALRPAPSHPELGYEELFLRAGGSWHVQGLLIEHCLSQGFTALGQRKLQALQEPDVTTEALWLVAEALQQGKHPAEAQELYTVLAARTPVSADDYVHCALAASRLKRWEAALVLLEDGLGQHPQHEQLQEQYRRICCQAGQVERLLASIDPDPTRREAACAQLFARGIDEPEVHVALIGYCLAEGYGALAAGELDGAQEEASDLVTLWRYGDAFTHLGRNKEARLFYRRLAALAPASEDEVLFKSIAAHRCKQLEEALGLLQEGMTKYPDAEILPKTFLTIAWEAKQLQRAIDFLSPAGVDRQQACEALFELAGDDWLLQAVLVAYALERGLAPVAERRLQALVQGGTPSLGLWRIAEVLQQHQHSGQARELFAVLSLRTPVTADDFMYGALGAARLKRWDTAIALLERALVLHPEHEELQDHYQRICCEARRVDRLLATVDADPARREAACGQLFARGIDDPDVHVTLIEYCLAQGYRALAARQLAAAQEKASGLVTLWRYGDAFTHLGRNEEAGPFYRRLATLAPETEDEVLFQALAAQRCKQLEQAMGLLQEGLAKYPEAAVLRTTYLTVACEAKQLQRAVDFLTPAGMDRQQACEALLDAAKNDWNLQAMLIAYCMEHGLAPFAALRLQAMRQEAAPALGLWQVADLLQLRKHRAEAEELYAFFATRTPRTADDYLYGALAAARLKKWEDAIALLERGLAAEPDNEDLVKHHLRICCEARQVERVLDTIDPRPAHREAACETLFARGPHEPEVHVSLIQYCLTHGYSTPAQRELRAVQAASPTLATLWRYGDALTYLGRSEEAHAFYQAMAPLQASSEDEFLYMAIAAYRCNHMEEAVAALQAGVARYPESDNLLQNLLNVASESNQTQRAIDFLTPAGMDQTQACRSLFERFEGSHVQASLIDYCLKAGMRELAEEKLRDLKERCKDPVILWRLADVLTHQARKDEAQDLYEQLAGMEATTEDDYYCKALSALRLDKTERCLSILEEGQTVHPDAKALFNVYVQICAGRVDFARYLAFVATLKPASFVRPTTTFEFYRVAINSGAPEAFLLSIKDIEHHSDPQIFGELEREFIAFLRRNPQPFLKAKLFVFLCKYLDVRAEFTRELLDILKDALRARSSDSAKEIRALDVLDALTPPMIPHYEYDAEALVERFVESCKAFAADPVALKEPIADMTNNWTPWQHIFCMAVPQHYGKVMAAFEQFALTAWPQLDHTAPHTLRKPELPTPQRKLRIGFLVHDAMPMMSGLIQFLDPELFESVFLRPGKMGATAAAKGWVARAGEVVQFDDLDTFSGMETIANARLDIIVSGPCTTYQLFPIMARLATLQVVLLEPNWTDGFRNADYYISWASAEPANPAEYYKSSVAYIEHPPYYIERPQLEMTWPMPEDVRADTRRRLLGLGSEERVYLCANTPPKVHVEMDDIFQDLLARDPKARLVLLRGEYPPAKSLRARLHKKLGKDYERIIFANTLPRNDAHLLLQSVDCCLDSYPLCGMSSSFDGAMLGVPIVTLPAEIPFSRWTASIYEYIGVSGLTAKDKRDYVDIAIRLASDATWRQQLAMEIKSKSGKYVESREAGQQVAEFIMEAWKRKVAGLPTANWMDRKWQ